MRIFATALLASALLATPFSRADDTGAPELRWTISALPQEVDQGDEIEIRFVADLPEGIIVYSSDFAGALGPRPARFTFDANDAVELTGPMQAIGSKPRTDKTFGTEYTYFAQRAEFVQKARLLQPTARITGRIDVQTCQEKDGVCALLREPFAVDLR